MVHHIKESGETFRAKDGQTGGDIYVKGKPQPYAFIQLNPKVFICIIIIIYLHYYYYLFIFFYVQ